MADDPEESKSAPPEPRKETLDAIKNPLIFFALALLIIESSLSVVLLSGKLEEQHNFYAVLLMSALFLVVVIVVTFLTYKAPANLMAKIEGLVKYTAREESRASAEVTVKDMFRSRTVQNLKKLSYDLSAFHQKGKIDALQKSRKEKGLEQSPYEVFVKPSFDRLLNDTAAAWVLPEDIRQEFEEILTNPSVPVEEVQRRLEEAITRIGSSQGEPASPR